MNEDVVADLKQFIATTVRVTVREELAETERRLDQKIDSRIDEVLSAIADTMEANTEHTEARLNDHEHRLIRLEHKPA